LQSSFSLVSGDLHYSVAYSDGNDFKSIDFKSRFQITFLICDFDFKSLGDQ